MALSRYCLDTSAYSQFQRGEQRIVDLVDSADWLGVPFVVVGELWLGFLLGDQRERNGRELEEFLSHPAVETLALDLATAQAYGEIVVALRTAGTPVPTNDIWIAACAARAGATVLTFDRHFRAIQRVGSLVLE